MLSTRANAPLDDVEFLARSSHRVPVLAALAERPRSRAELRALTGASASTVGRTLRAFEDRNWIRRDGDGYDVTRLGGFVAAGMNDVVERFETERELRGVWRWLPSEASGFTIEMATDAVVTVPDADAPYRPVNRFASLLGETSQFQFAGFDVALLEPCKDELRERILDGMRAEIIDPPGVARYILSTHGDPCAPVLESDNLQVLVHDDLPPYGVSLFDDRVAISCYDQDSGVVRVLLDTDSPAARDWAAASFDAYRREARPLPLEPTVP